MAHSTKKLGMMFTIVGWSIALLVLILVFSKILDQQNNPNRSVSTVNAGNYQEVVLKRGRNGHYIFNGEINHRPVTFMVDTGASTIAIPGGLQQGLGIELGPATAVSTASGRATADAGRAPGSRRPGVG